MPRLIQTGQVRGTVNVLSIAGREAAPPLPSSIWRLDKARLSTIPEVPYSDDFVVGRVQWAISHPEEVRAYRHENGFEKLTLGVDPSTGALLRAHFWGRGYKAITSTQGNFHNHRWDFASTVLQGELQITKFEEASSGQAFQHYRYWPERGDELELVGASHLREVAVEHYSGGTEYYEPASDIHHALPLYGADTVTLMARSVSRRAYADVYTQRDRPEFVDHSAPLPVNRVRDLLFELADLLDRRVRAQG